MTLVLLVRVVDLTVVLPLREAHGEGGEVTHNHQLEKSCFAAQILTSSASGSDNHSKNEYRKRLLKTKF